MDERTAVISCSGAAKHLGEIVDVNMPIIKMFGYARSELIGVNIARLMPSIYGCAVYALFKNFQISSMTYMYHVTIFIHFCV